MQNVFNTIHKIINERLLNAILWHDLASYIDNSCISTQICVKISAHCSIDVCILRETNKFYANKWSVMPAGFSGESRSRWLHMYTFWWLALYCECIRIHSLPSSHVKWTTVILILYIYFQGWINDSHNENHISLYCSIEILHYFTHCLSDLNDLFNILLRISMDWVLLIATLNRLQWVSLHSIGTGPSEYWKFL